MKNLVQVELRVSIPLYIYAALPSSACEDDEVLKQIGIDLAIATLDGVSELADSQKELMGVLDPSDYCEVCTVTHEDEL